VTRAALILCVLVLLPSGIWSRPAAAVVAFDTATAASVWAAALAYIAPRALEKLTIPQMTIWGLNGLAALDPDLNATFQDNQIRLYGPEELLLAVPAPPPDDAQAWGKAAAQIAAAAFNASPALQQAGTQGLISSFFDELFNHFDPYSRYEPPIQAAHDQLIVMGLAGTGISLAAQDNNVIISAISPDSPAEAAGLSPGTIVHNVDGRAAYPWELSTLNDAMNGIAGTTTTLTLADPDDPSSTQDVTIARGYIPPDTVFNEPAPSPGILALKIVSFNKGTSDQFSSTIAAAMAATPPPTGLLLDLRGNRGGILRQAVLVADSLLPAGAIAQAAGRDPDADQSFTAEGSDLTNGLHIVVLVDGQTASAAEILAAALADNRRAVVVGSETLGKGLVQTVTSLPDGGELYITWSRVLAPHGWPLQTLGLMPNVCTSLGESALDSELAALQKGHNLMTQALTQARATRAPASVNQILAIRDNCPADIGSDLDPTTAAFLLGNPSAYNAALLR
jgi:carboxyl-terminal processing protease